MRKNDEAEMQDTDVEEIEEDEVEDLASAVGVIFGMISAFAPLLIILWFLATIVSAFMSAAGL